MQRTSILTMAALLFVSLPAHAYVGPGVGAGTIAVVLGILASIVLAFLGLLWYPIKRMLKKFRKPEVQDEEPAATETVETASESPNQPPP